MKIFRSFTIGIGMLVMSAASQAATLSVSVSAKLAENTGWAISDYGTLDWAVWAKATTDADKSSPSNSKLNATAISNINSLGGSLTTSTNGPPDWDFTYTDGTSPAGPGTNNVGGVFTTPVATTGTGLSLTVTLPTTNLYQISVWAAGYNLVAGKLTATLAQATTQSASFAADTLNLKDMYLYTILAQADAVGNVVTIELINSDTSALGSSHVIISAVAVSQVPEISATVLSMIGLCAACGSRRRR